MLSEVMQSSERSLTDPRVDETCQPSTDIDVGVDEDRAMLCGGRWYWGPGDSDATHDSIYASVPPPGVFGSAALLCTHFRSLVGLQRTKQGQKWALNVAAMRPIPPAGGPVTQWLLRE